LIHTRTIVVLADHAGLPFPNPTQASVNRPNAKLAEQRPPHGAQAGVAVDYATTSRAIPVPAFVVSADPHHRSCWGASKIG